jgi:osmotically-inducible protein OsmY
MDQQPATEQSAAGLVREALRADVRFQTSSIAVSTENGAIVLSGIAPNPAIRAAAVAVARRTRGVSRIIDRIRVQPFVPRFDTDITADVVTAMTLSTRVNAAKVDVETVDGVVYLRGTVPDPTARQMIDSLARATDGVRDVIDELVVEPPVPHPDSEIERMLRERLDQLLRPEAASRIHLTVHHGVAYLQGEVESTALRWAIEDLARWTPGVLDIVDQLRGPTAPRSSDQRR